MKSNLANYPLNYPAILMFGVILLLLQPQGAPAQTVSMAAGIQHNRFTDYGKARTSSFTPGWGYQLQAGIEDIPNKQLNMSAFLRFDYYQGSFMSISGSPMTASVYEGSTRKWQLGVTLYLFEWVAFQKIHLQLGADVGVHLSSTSSGTNQVSSSSGTSSTPLEEVPGLHKQFTAALAGRISWRIPLNGHLDLVPQSALLYGLSPDLSLAAPVFSIRPTVAVGLLYRR